MKGSKGHLAQLCWKSHGPPLWSISEQDMIELHGILETCNYRMLRLVEKSQGRHRLVKDLKGAVFIIRFSKNQ